MSTSNPYDAPNSNIAYPTASRTRRICNIDPMSVGKILGALYAILGLLVGGVMALFAVIGGAAGGNGDAAIGGAIGGVAAVIIMPLMYGVMGLVGGIISAFLYNVIAGMVGGIKIDIEG